MTELKITAYAKWDGSTKAMCDISNIAPGRTLGLTNDLHYFILLAAEQPVVVNLEDVVAKNLDGAVFVIDKHLASLMFDFG